MKERPMTPTPDRYRDRAKGLALDLFIKEHPMLHEGRAIEAISAFASSVAAEAWEEGQAAGHRDHGRCGFAGCSHTINPYRSLAKAPVSNGETKEGGAKP